MSTEAKPRTLLLNADDLAASLGVGREMIGRWVEQGMPCLWTGGAKGTGIRLFHAELVEDWLKRRMLAESDPGPAESAPSRQGRGRAGGIKPAAKVAGKYSI